MSEIYPPVSFYFQLSFSDEAGKSETSFAEVSGISAEVGNDEITGSEYPGTPTAAKYSNLILKRGIMTRNSAVATWCSDSLSNITEPIITKNIVISLLNEEGTPLKSWSFVNSWPVKWTISDLNSMNNEIAIESLEFAYSYFQVL